ncbi:transglycosylase domain-containing protein [Candidatus Daviesbacteria bacterium]|nr:transglycosylase domain-containing protein [Candidatus Daviesbacteria bacterium]
MPKGQRKTNFKNNPSSLILLLVQFILIKIGQAPIWVIKLLLSIAVGGYLRARRALDKPRLTWRAYPSHAPSGAWRRTLALASKRVWLPTEATKRQYLFNQFFHRRRGRPRKSSFIPYYLNKFKLFVKRRVPKKTKIAVVFGVGLIILTLYTQFILNAADTLPNPDKLISPRPATTEIFDRNGKLLYRIYEGTNRSLVRMDELPKHLILATLASEDKNFYNHPGVDPVAIFRAFYHNLRFGRTEGASTITQQLIKNSFLTPEKTYSRKIKEVILSLWTETRYSKEEILKMYFNEAPYGGPNWGIKAAARSYFGKKPVDLTLAEAAFLAGLPASPSQFSPYGVRADLGIARQKQVLKRMLDEHYITDGEYTQAISEKLTFRPQNQDINAPHFVFYIRDILAQRYGEKTVSQGGLKVITTLDLGLQKEVEKIISDEIANLAGLDVKNGASMVLDAKEGQILAMVGSRDYSYPEFGNFNATLALRQPGSSIKPITYATAFKEGYFPGNTILDSPVTFPDGARNYSPINYDGVFHGPVSIRTALGSSLNVPAVKLLASVGIPDMIKTAQDLGITTFDDPKRFGLSLTLGGGEVKMMEMMGVYQAFSQMGLAQKPTGILKVTDSVGNILEEYESQPKQVLQPEVAYLITSILSDNTARTPAFGPNSLLLIRGNEVAVKTGTSDNKRDNWTFGYTPDFVVGVWVGNNDNTPMNPQLTSGITGATPIWNKIIRGLLAQKPSLGFIKPSGIIEAQIDGRRDLAISGFIPKGLVKVRTQDVQTIYFDSFSSYATQSAQAALESGTRN